MKKNSPHHHVGITPRVRATMARAAGLVAMGKTYGEIAQTLKTTDRALRWQRNHYPELWQAALDKAAENSVAIVREAAGSDAVMQDIDGYLAMACTADKWCQRHDEVLFQGNGETTLSTFFETYYLPNCLADATPATHYLYRVILRRWTLIVGGVPIEKITTHVLARFRDALAQSRGEKPASRKSPNTVAAYLQRVQTLIDKAGPRGPRNRDALGLLKDTPWVRPPREVFTPPRVIPEEYIERCYLAAVCMTKPKLWGIKPPRWWRALLVLVWNTALRRNTLFGLRTADLDWENARVHIPPQRLLKGRRGEIMPLNRTVMDHLRAIRTQRELIFEWPCSETYFDKSFRRLQAEAGIMPENHFGLQNLRATVASRLCQTESPEAAALILGHTSFATTAKHYINLEAVRRTIVDRLPQPAAFTKQ